MFIPMLTNNDSLSRESGAHTLSSVKLSFSNVILQHVPEVQLRKFLLHHFFIHLGIQLVLAYQLLTIRFTVPLSQYFFRLKSFGKST